MLRNSTGPKHANALIRAKRWRVPPGIIVLSALLIGTIFAFAGLYYVAGGRWGGGFTPSDGTFLECVYFSVVTITTLGYGDMRPDGWFRLLACAEVITGVIFVGLFINRLFGWQQSYQLNILLAGKLDDDLSSFREELKKLNGEGRRLAASLSAKSATAAEIERLLGPANNTKGGVFDEIAAVTSAFARHVRHATRSYPYYKHAPVRSFARLLGEVRDSLQLIIDTVPPNLQTGYVNVDPKRLSKRSWRIAENAAALAQSAKADTNIDDYAHLADVLNQLVARIRQEALINEHGAGL